MRSFRLALAGCAVLGAMVGMARIGQAAHGPAPVRIGAIYPLSGSQGGGGTEEYRGVQTAARLVNESGGVHGRPIEFVTANAPSADAAPDAVDSLKRQGLDLVVGAYGSTISLPASDEAQRQGMIYWESGAVATMVTERGYRNVFRTVTTGDSLGRAAARYVAGTVAPRLRFQPRQLRTVVMYVTDVYGTSVGTAMVAEARSQGLNLVGVLTYNPYAYNMRALVARLKALRPDAVMVAAYVNDAIAFRRETVRQHLHPAVMIGTSSSFCMSAFAAPLGRQAVGLFASDKPDASFSPAALRPAARALLARATSAYRKAYGVAMTAPAVAGFVAGWILFHDVLPSAGSLTPAAVRRAALSVDLPYGSEINGAGVRFAPPGAPDEGQNMRAISVIWQWQRPNHAAIVYPPNFANARPIDVPLPGWRRA